MKGIISRFALAVALTTGAVAVNAVVPATAVAQKKAKAPKLSVPVQSALAEAQKLQQANDFDGALAKTAEAEQAAKSPDDRFFVGQIRYNLGIAKKDNAVLESASKQMLDSGVAPDDMKAPLIQNLAAFALQRQDPRAALTYYQQLAALTPNNPEVIVGLAELYQQNRMTPQAIETLQKAIDAKKAAGQPVEETWYKRKLAIAYDAKRMDLLVPASLALVGAYPTADNWRDSLVIFRGTQKVDDQTNLDLMRLQRATNSLKGEADYYEYADLAYRRGLFGESKAVLDKGVGANQISLSKSTFKELNGLVTAKLAGDKASLTKLDTQARAAANGRLALGTADAWLGYGEYAKAADLYKVALAKGGVEADVANTRLGIALSESGDKVGAKAALEKVTTGARGQVARYWLAHVDRAA
jgi:tetratricopeptide (TPR) repeat protein